MFALVGIIFLTKIYLAVIDKKFRSLPTNTVLAGLITLQMSSGIMFSAARPLFYELAISGGFMCVTIGAYLLMTSNILWDGKISYVRLGFASFFLGYACSAARRSRSIASPRCSSSRAGSKKRSTDSKRSRRPARSSNMRLSPSYRSALSPRADGI